MINSLCGCMGSLKSENSCTKLPSTSPSESILSESKKTPSSSEFEQNSLTPSSLSLTAIKFEVDGDVEIQSPDNSLWESFFSEHFDGDFMISSPVGNLPSPQASNYNCNYNYAQPMHGQSLLGCSPPRLISSQLGAYSSNYKGKGLSPLHKVFNSPNNQRMQPESLSLPALESILDDYDQTDDDLILYSTIMKSTTSGAGSSSESFDTLTTVPALLDCLTLPNSSRFCGSASKTSVPATGGSHLSQESDIFHMGSIPTAPLSQQLQHERHQEKEKQQQQPPPTPQQQQQQQKQGQDINHSLMMPLSVGPEQEQDSGLQLVHLLLACAEAVAKEDYMLARRYLHHLNRVVTPLGDSMQRVASCFTEALSARLAATLAPKPSTSTQKPFTPFSSKLTRNPQDLPNSIPSLPIHILQGYQWPAFMQALAARPSGAPFLRITGVGASPESVRETGRCLTELAHSLHVPFEFHPVGEELEDLKPHMFNRRVGEALAVNSVNRLHRVPGNCLGNLLAMIRDQAPNIVTVVEQEASHNGPYFLGRFLEALHYYSAIFDSLDATFPPDSSQRAKVEQYIFAPEIQNIVACEGPERVMRHERLEKWRKLMEGKGFKGVSLSANAVTQSKILLGLYSCDGYRLTEDNGCLLLGWQDRAILAASAWRC
ncbi:hypothetical protein F0562_004479 [Nyssa sinensis]|uniref:Uncharacterized protein n=1 Tax=Nyssa sinensis TaxID=561372 RepID=A0A5J5C287_9ASTE|nr:hypothetical protein F0562_004479 [Nyssa sinensis]